MKGENIVCIFAHPDDEAFGPSGTIAKWAKENNVYLICVTDVCGQSGKINKLGIIRRKELQKSASILGIKMVYFLGYPDGELRNNIYHKVAADIEKILKYLKPQTLLTYELRGISGHIDHVFTAMVSSFLFRKLRFIRKLFYFVQLRELSELESNYFIFFPEGYQKDDIDRIEDVSKVWTQKTAAIKTHKSQVKDGKSILTVLNIMPKEEYFQIKTKDFKTGLNSLKAKASITTKLLLHQFK